MKKLLFVLLLPMLYQSPILAQNINPYKTFGYQPKNKYVITKKPQGFELENTDSTATTKSLVVSPQLGKVFSFNKAGDVQIDDVNPNDKLRFLSVDPLTGKYPELTPYQFASNSPISGIDLDGLEYLNTNESRIRIDGTKVSLNLSNCNQVTQNIWNHAAQDTHNWSFTNGKQDIGISREIGNLKIPDVSTNPDGFLSLDNTTNSYGVDATYNPTNIKTIGEKVTNTGRYDRRQGHTLSGSGASTRGVAVAVLAIDAINWGLESYANYQTNEDRELLNNHISLLKKQVLDNLHTAENTPGMIPSKYMNAQNLGDISNVILTGVNLTKDKGIYDVGIKIVKDIAHNYKGYQYKKDSADHTKVTK